MWYDSHSVRGCRVHKESSILSVGTFSSGYYMKLAVPFVIALTTIQLPHVCQCGGAIQCSSVECPPPPAPGHPHDQGHHQLFCPPHPQLSTAAHGQDPRWVKHVLVWMNTDIANVKY